MIWVDLGIDRYELESRLSQASGKALPGEVDNHLREHVQQYCGQDGSERVHEGPGLGLIGAGQGAGHRRRVAHWRIRWHWRRGARLRRARRIAYDEAAEMKKMQEELTYLEGFLKSVDAKLNNDRFVANAKPDVIEKEKQKRADALEKIEKLKQSLTQNNN